VQFRVNQTVLAVAYWVLESAVTFVANQQLVSSFVRCRRSHACVKATDEVSVKEQCKCAEQFTAMSACARTEHRCAVNTTTAIIVLAATRSDAQNPNHIYQWCHHNKRVIPENRRL
jgi:hypothetical protein